MKMSLINWLKVLLITSVCLSVLLMVQQHRYQQDSSFKLRSVVITKAIPALASVSLLTSTPNVELTRNQCVNNLEFASNPVQGNANETLHVAFLKVHKAASTTVFNIFYRFGQQRDLTFIVPRVGHDIGRYTSMRKRQIFPPPGHKTFDIACLHAVFEKEVYEAYLPNDTVYIATVREPTARLMSALWYYRKAYDNTYLANIPGPNILSNFIQDPTKYEPKDVYFSHTNNRMALDFGYPADQFNDTSHFKNYLKILDARFDVVIDTQMFPESLILMKRKLKWSLKNVLSLPQNRMKKQSIELSKSQADAVSKFLHLDYMLYNHFTTRLKSAIGKQSADFVEEVDNLKHVQRHVSKLCSRIGFCDMGNILIIGESKWNKRFEVNFCDCVLMMLKEVPAVVLLQRVMERKLKNDGPNREFFLSRPK